jgi:hypothetical protein
MATVAWIVYGSASVLAATPGDGSLSLDKPAPTKTHSSSSPDAAAAPVPKKRADEGKSSGASKPNNRPKNVSPPFTPEREAAAMAFVREHQPEVADLLERLKANRPVQYRRAAQQLFRSSEQVARWKDRDHERYDLELKAWKTTSRIQLLMARATMASDKAASDEFDASLRAALVEQQETRIALRKLERDRLAHRLAAADKDVARLTADRDAAVEKQLVSLHENLENSRRNLRAKGSRRGPKRSGESNEAKPADVKKDAPERTPDDRAAGKNSAEKTHAEKQRAEKIVEKTGGKGDDSAPK